MLQIFVLDIGIFSRDTVATHGDMSAKEKKGLQ